MESIVDGLLWINLVLIFIDENRFIACPNRATSNKSSSGSCILVVAASYACYRLCCCRPLYHFFGFVLLLFVVLWYDIAARAPATVTLCSTKTMGLLDFAILHSKSLRGRSHHGGRVERRQGWVFDSFHFSKFGYVWWMLTACCHSWEIDLHTSRSRE